MPPINPCLHISTCEPCCPVYNLRALAESDAVVEMTLTIVTQSQRKRFVYHIPPKSDAIFLTDRPKEIFLWPYVDSQKPKPRQREWPEKGDPLYGRRLNEVTVEES